VHAFALPLGIPGNVTLADESMDERLRRDAIRRMLHAEDAGPLLESLRVLVEGQTDRPVVATVDALVRGLASLHRQTEPAAWRWMQRRAMPFERTADLRAAIEAYRAVVPTVNKHHQNAHRDDCRRLDAAFASSRVEDWVAVITKGFGNKIALGELLHHRKPIEDFVWHALEPLVDHARAVVWNATVTRTQALDQLLTSFNDAYAAAKDEQRVITFEDLTSRMIQAQSLATFPEICFRLDASLDHLLLDEFQDTSTQQWAALAPIACEMVSDVSQPRSVFCVGDVKQSIYGWRRAAPEILASLPEHLAGPHGDSVIETETLAKSRRSSPEVIDAVNAIFGSLDRNPALEDFGEAAAAWATSFETHDTTQTAPGFVELRAAPEPDVGLKAKDERMVAAADLVADLHRRNPARRIGVLMRTNECVSRMLYELGPTQRDIPAAGVGGAALTDAAATGAILDLLHLADHPDDSAAAFNAACSPLGPVVGLVTPPPAGGGEARGEDRPHAELDREPDPDLEPGPGPETEPAGDRGPAIRRPNATTRHRVARLVRRSLLERGFAATLQGWIAQIAGYADQREQRRLHQLVELAERFDTSPTLRPAEFVAAAEIRRVEDGGAAPVEVMTVHQSKGLEFEVVVLADLDRAIISLSKEKLMLETAEPQGAITRVSASPPRGARAAVPELAELSDLHAQRLARESLCLLYVAITRARRGLFMIIDPRPKPDLPKSIAGVIRGALAPEGPVEPGATLYRQGSDDWLDDDAKAPAAPGDAAASAAPTPPDGWNVPQRSRLLAPAVGRPSIRGALQDRDETAAARGTILHRLMEHVGWIEDYTVDRDELERLAFGAAPACSPARAQAVVSEFVEMLDVPTIREALRRPAGAARLWRERPFAFVDANGDVQHGIMDRLVETDALDGARAARVIDYKSDRVDPPLIAERADRYRRQLGVYREAAASQLGLAPERVTMAILFLSAGQMVELE
jgi:ATP-dependent exoDNAse (exonuclease V) beta subunit